MCPLHLNRNAWPIATFVLCCYHCSLVGIRLCSIPQETVPSYLPSNVFCHVQHARRTMPKEEKHAAWYQNFYPCEDPLCATMQHFNKKKKAIRVVCSNGWHMWTLASLRSVFNLTQFQSTFSNRWASLRDYTWPPGQTPATATETRHSNSCWVIRAIQMSFPLTHCEDNWQTTAATHRIVTEATCLNVQNSCLSMFT